MRLRVECTLIMGSYKLEQRICISYYQGNTCRTIQLNWAWSSRTWTYLEGRLIVEWFLISICRTKNRSYDQPHPRILEKETEGLLQVHQMKGEGSGGGGLHGGNASGWSVIKKKNDAGKRQWKGEQRYAARFVSKSAWRVIFSSVQIIAVAAAWLHSVWQVLAASLAWQSTSFESSSAQF